MYIAYHSAFHMQSALAIFIIVHLFINSFSKHLLGISDKSNTWEYKN